MIPATMNSIKANGNGEAEVMVLTTSSVPKPAAHEVLIRVLATGINRPDILQRKGLYPPPVGASPVLGLEVAGEIVATGREVSQFAVGDHVCALTNGGGYAEYCVTPATQCLPWPKGYTAIEAAALPENYFTVWVNVFQQGHLGPNESLLVHGGSSGIGVTAIQLAREFAGKVYATAGSQEKCEACLNLGATAAIDYKAEDFEQRILDLTQGQGVDMVLDMVGAAYFTRNLNCLTLDGRLIEIGTQQGAIVDHFDLRQVLKKRLVITGSALRPRSTAEKAEIARALFEKVWPVLDQGRCKPLIYKIFSFDQVQEAHRLMESSQHIGKIVMTWC